MSSDHDDTIYFKEWRQFADLTQAQLGEEIGITGSQVSRIETGARDFDGSYLKAFRTAINKALAHHPLHSRATQVRISRLCDPLCIKPDPDLWLDLDPRLQQLRAAYNKALAMIVREGITRQHEEAAS